MKMFDVYVDIGEIFYYTCSEVTNAMRQFHIYGIVRRGT